MSKKHNGAHVEGDHGRRHWIEARETGRASTNRGWYLAVLLVSGVSVGINSCPGPCFGGHIRGRHSIQRVLSQTESVTREEGHERAADKTWRVQLRNGMAIAVPWGLGYMFGTKRRTTFSLLQCYCSRVYGHFSWFPRMDMRLELLTALVLGKVTSLALTPWAYRKQDGCGRWHTHRGNPASGMSGADSGSSSWTHRIVVHFEGAAPAVYTAPLLVILAAYLDWRLRNTRGRAVDQRPRKGNRPAPGWRQPRDDAGAKCSSGTPVEAAKHSELRGQHVGFMNGDRARLASSSTCRGVVDEHARGVDHHGSGGFASVCGGFLRAEQLDSRAKFDDDVRQRGVVPAPRFRPGPPHGAAGRCRKIFLQLAMARASRPARLRASS